MQLLNALQYLCLVRQSLITSPALEVKAYSTYMFIFTTFFTTVAFGFQPQAGGNSIVCPVLSTAPYGYAGLNGK